MDYHKFIDRVQKLGYIGDEQTADSAVKTILSMLASRVPEDLALDFTERLPRQLDLETLRGSQTPPTTLTVDQYAGVIGNQFHLSPVQTRELINTVWQTTRDTIGNQQFFSLSKALPGDWSEALRNVKIPRTDPRHSMSGGSD